MGERERGENMTKKERELEHDRQTLMMMSSVSKHAEIQQMVRDHKAKQESRKSWTGIYYLIAACAGAFITMGVQMLVQWI